VCGEGFAMRIVSNTTLEICPLTHRKVRSRRRHLLIAALQNVAVPTFHAMRIAF
jgi:hypothetical protein